MTASLSEATRLRLFVEFEGAYLHVVHRDQIPLLAITNEHAAGTRRSAAGVRSAYGST